MPVYIQTLSLFTLWGKSQYVDHEHQDCKDKFSKSNQSRLWTQLFSVCIYEWSGLPSACFHWVCVVARSSCPGLFLSMFQRVSKGIIVVTLPSWSLQSVLVSNVLAAPLVAFLIPQYMCLFTSALSKVYFPLEDRNAHGFPQRHLSPSWFPSSFQNYVLFQAWANLLRTWSPTLGFYPNNSLQILDGHDSPHVSVGHRSLLYFHTFQLPCIFGSQCWPIRSGFLDFHLTSLSTITLPQ